MNEFWRVLTDACSVFAAVSLAKQTYEYPEPGRRGGAWAAWAYSAIITFMVWGVMSENPGNHLGHLAAMLVCQAVAIVVWLFQSESGDTNGRNTPAKSPSEGKTPAEVSAVNH